MLEPLLLSQYRLREFPGGLHRKQDRIRFVCMLWTHEEDLTKVVPMPGQTRSEVMSRIRSSNTGPELILRKALWAGGMRYRTTSKDLVCRPDVVFPKQRLAIFLDGCFWHGCPEHYVLPRTRQAFWGGKLAANVERDERQTRELEAAGWRVARFMEHDVFTKLDFLVAEVANLLATSNSAPAEVWRVIRVDEGVDGLESRAIRELRSGKESVVIRPRTTRKWKRAT